MLSKEEYEDLKFWTSLKARKIHNRTSKEMLEAFLQDEALLHDYELRDDKEQRADCVKITLSLDRDIFISLAASARRKRIITNKYIEKILEKAEDPIEKKTNIFYELFSRDLEGKIKEL